MKKISMVFLIASKFTGVCMCVFICVYAHKCMVDGYPIFVSLKILSHKVEREVRSNVDSVVI